MYRALDETRVEQWEESPFITKHLATLRTLQVKDSTAILQ